MILVYPAGGAALALFRGDTQKILAGLDRNHIRDGSFHHIRKPGLDPNLPTQRRKGKDSSE